MMKLNSLERVRKAMRLEEPDVVPVGPYMGNHAARIAGIPLQNYYTDSQKMFEAQMFALDAYHQDIVIMQSDNYYLAEGFGTKTTHYLDATPTFEAPAIERLQDVSTLKIPDPWNDGRMPVYLEAISKASEEIGKDVAVRGCGTGPFVLASHIVGTEKFLLDLANSMYGLPGGDESAILDLMELTTEALLQFCIAQLEAGAHIVQCADSLASLDMISPKTYKKYVFPYNQKFFQQLQPYLKKYGGYGVLHICGNNTKVLDLYGETGADCYEVDYKVDLTFCKQQLGQTLCLMGNINPTAVLLQGSVQEVERAAVECIEAAAAGGGFILGSGCEVPVATPRENIKALVRMARQYSYE
jgi:uroporphyrinogen decarboxylase